jgi:hypothetical protein
VTPFFTVAHVEATILPEAFKTGASLAPVRLIWISNFIIRSSFLTALEIEELTWAQYPTLFCGYT